MCVVMGTSPYLNSGKDYFTLVVLQEVALPLNRLSLFCAWQHVKHSTNVGKRLRSNQAMLLERLTEF